MRRRFLKWTVRIVLVLLFIIFVLPLLIPLPPDGVAASTFADPDGRFITVNGLDTYVRERGEPDEPVVLLLHGWGGSTFSWREQFDALDEAGYRVIAFDRPPYGLSQKTGELPLSQRQQAEFSIAVMDSLDLDSATLVGHSMGGGVIGYMAALAPERVERLVFVDGVPRVEEPAPVAATGSNRLSSAVGIPPFLVSAIDFPPVNRWIRIGLRTFLQPDTFTNMQRTAYYDPATVTDEVAAGYQQQLQVVGWDEAMIDIVAGRSFADAPLTEAEVQAITAPTLIVWGDNDTWVPIASGERFADVMAGETFVTFSETGHMPMEEHPARFNEELLRFLAAGTES